MNFYKIGWLKNEKKYPFILFAFSILGIIMIFRLQEQKKHIKLTKVPYKIEDVLLTHRKGNEEKWNLISKNAYIRESEGIMELTDIIMNIKEGDGIMIEGGKGIYNEKGNTVIIYDPVIISMKTYKLFTNSLTWDGENKTITTDDPVQLKGNDVYIEGEGILFKPEEENVELKRNVKATFFH